MRSNGWMRAGGRKSQPGRRKTGKHPGDTEVPSLFEELSVIDPAMGPISRLSGLFTIGSIDLIFQYHHKSFNLVSTYHVPSFAKHLRYYFCFPQHCKLCLTVPVLKMGKLRLGASSQ